MAEGVGPAEAVPALRTRRVDVSAAVFGIAALILLFMVIVPLAWIFVGSVHSDADETLTLSNYARAFTRSIYLTPIWNALVLATASAAIATLFGTVLSWAVSRTDMPGRNLIRIMVFAAFATPSFLGATAWIFLAAPNSGWLNRIWIALTGAERGPFNIYSLGGAIFVIALYSFPYTFSFASSALELVPSDMERAAALLGARWPRITWSITPGPFSPFSRPSRNSARPPSCSSPRASR